MTAKVGLYHMHKHTCTHILKGKERKANKRMKVGGKKERRNRRERKGRGKKRKKRRDGRKERRKEEKIETGRGREERTKERKRKDEQPFHRTAQVWPPVCSD